MTFYQYQSQSSLLVAYMYRYSIYECLIFFKMISIDSIYNISYIIRMKKKHITKNQSIISSKNTYWVLLIIFCFKKLVLSGNGLGTFGKKVRQSQVSKLLTMYKIHMIYYQFLYRKSHQIKEALLQVSILKIRHRRHCRNAGQNY